MWYIKAFIKGDIIEIESSPEPVKSQDEGKGKGTRFFSQDDQQKRKNKWSVHNIPKTPQRQNVSAESSPNNTFKAGPSTFQR